ncbi:hypothetical protein H2508_00775 [Parahaliea sp. F7430]|uniref:TonB family protein n=1 Tax=Sediminihaliea albiluteola TaxID=2758564 RepID=A0A7W2TTH9_9GAMM|nr:hypothetical protein [Sediminihaliea albiluteola]MBA6411653.1 hypothetical protein [Sediminihaliea albiluteola]
MPLRIWQHCSSLSAHAPRLALAGLLLYHCAFSLAQTEPADLAAYRASIVALERSEGAYSSKISEQLLGLGTALQQADLHAEAITVLKRGVHLSRINNGLYCLEQIPLLEAQIQSHFALGEYAAVNERQAYLYRVQTKVLPEGLQRAEALMQQANWQHQAYQLGLDNQDTMRLINIWELQRLALHNVIAQEGEHSPKVLAPLYGMLRAQYLIFGHQSPKSSFDLERDSVEQQRQNRFNHFRSQSYKQGLSVIYAIADIELSSAKQKPLAAAQNNIRLGDWLLWHGKESQAMEAYQQAFTELARMDDAQLQAERLLGQPAALPTLAGVGKLPPVVDPAQANAVLQFDITDRGKVVELQRLDDNDNNKGQVKRLMRQLRKTRFRPRFEAGVPVTSNDVVWAYDSKTW